MAISLASLKRKGVVKPPMMLFYAVAGFGKTTFAAGAPDPVVLAVEKGLGQLDVPHWDIGAYPELMEAIGVLYSEEHDRRTVVLDSLDWAEPLVWAETCRRNSWKSIEDASYGKGYLAAIEVWRELLDGLAALRDERNMAVVLLAHEKIKRFDSPETEPYDRYQIKLHEKAAAIVQEQCDIVAFGNYRVSISKSDVGFNKKVARAVGGAQRVVFLEERPAFHAKNRYSLPASVDLPGVPDAWKQPQLIWDAFARHLPETTTGA
jgi:hypothetical protein